MLELMPAVRAKSKLSVLCLGAHSDDIEIGCGGTILRLLGACGECDVTWVVFSAKAQRRREAVSSARRFLLGARTSTVIVKSFNESFFPYRGEAIKSCFEELKLRLQPDLIFTHYRLDLHQDHRVICELTWNTFRKHQIFEYEIPKYDADLGQPNIFVPLTKALCKKKVKGLMDGFPTQRSKQWFTEDTFYALLRLRGVESNALEKYAEAFHGRKIVLG
jgi:LmbE family N-acetylglucosaminyl deacetylase